MCQTVLFLALWILLEELQCLFHSLEWDHFSKRWCFTPMKTMTGRQYSFKQVSQFTMLNNMLDPLPSNMKHFLRSTTIFLHSLERGSLAQSWCSSPRKKLRARQYSFKQQTQFQLQNKVLAPLASNMNDSLTEATLHLPFSCMGPFSAKVMFLILEITKR
jgi:hypothetical protein